jgi:hypothetical protein
LPNLIIGLEADNHNPTIQNAIIGSFSNPVGGIPPYTFTFDFGDDNNDNSLFRINGTNLTVFPTAGLTEAREYSVRVNVRDNHSNNFTKVITFAVIPSPIIGAGLYLGDPWAGGVRRSVEANNISAALIHVNASTTPAGEYTLLIDRDVTVNQLTPSSADSFMTIIGLGAERKIQHNTSGIIFSMSSIESRITIGNNITLIGNENSGPLVRINGGEFIMLPGSKITGHTNTTSADTNNVGAVRVAGMGSKFTMEGGEISGNETTGLGIYSTSTGGVFVGDHGEFNMKGGTITGNTNSHMTHDKVDVFVSENSATFTISGNAHVGALMLNQGSSSNAHRSMVTIGASGFTGTVGMLNLRGQEDNLNTIEGWWCNNFIINNVANDQILTRFTLGRFFARNGGSNDRLNTALELHRIAGGAWLRVKSP